MQSGGGETRPPVVFLPTLRHSGSNFVADLLGLPVYRLKVWTGEPGTVRTHFDGLHNLARVYAFNGPVVIPLRRPEAMTRSHMARYGHVAMLTSGLIELRRFIESREPLWLPIDAPDRDKYLARLSEGLGMELTTDWPVIDSRSPDYSGAVTPIGHEDFFSRFYG